MKIWVAALALPRVAPALVTLRNRKLAKGQFIADATYVPSGVAEVTRLQQREVLLT
jgi:intracellular sulfur oxidation DsrE/DsrF family protein